jgi:hypothetical protein
MHAEIGVREWPLGGWKAIAEPRVQRVAFFVVYLLHIVAGVALGLVQPRAANYEFGNLVTNAWASFFIIGGVLGALAVIPGWNFVERVGLLSLMFAIGLTSLFIAANPWSPAGLDVIIWALVTGWLVMFIYRLWEIRVYAIAPK